MLRVNISATGGGGKEEATERGEEKEQGEKEYLTGWNHCQYLYNSQHPPRNPPSACCSDREEVLLHLMQKAEEIKRILYH